MKLDLRELHALNLIRLYQHLVHVENMEFTRPNQVSMKFPLHKLIDQTKLNEMADLKQSLLQEIEELAKKLDLKGKPTSEIEAQHLQSILSACDAVVSKGDISKAFDYRELSRLYRACQAMISSFNKDYSGMKMEITLKHAALQKLAEDLKLDLDEFQTLAREFVNNINLAEDASFEDAETHSLKQQYHHLYSISFWLISSNSSKQDVEKALKAVDSRIDARLKDLK